MCVPDCVFSPWTLSLIVAILGYVYITSNKSKTKHLFDEHGIPFKQPRAIFGNYGGLLMRQTHFYDFMLNLYNEFKGSSVFGIFFFNRPVLVLNDLHLIKQVMVKDFDHFVDHPNRATDTNAEPILWNSLIVLEGEKWRDMRNTLSPAFTGAKLRHMFQLVVECSERTVAILKADAAASAGPWVPELRQLFSYFANDVIASAAFGVEVNSVKDNKNRFYVLGKKSLDVASLKFLFRAICAGITQKFSKRFGTRIFSADVVQFFDSLVHDTIAAREQHNISRPDMIQLLMQAQTRKQEDGALRWSRDDITAQCYLFFLAGFETISNTLSMLCHELMVNPEIQDRLRAEIDDYRSELNGATIGYDDLGKLKYMEMVISETLRKYPTPMLDRECRQDISMTTSDGKTFVVPKGTSVMVPVYGIHYDPKYYPNPTQFDPERFSEANRHTIDPMTYLPFGVGPRSCIGMRMAMMELKAFLFMFLSAFTLERAATSQIPLKYANAGFTIKSEKGVNVHLKPRFYE